MLVKHGLHARLEEIQKEINIVQLSLWLISGVNEGSMLKKKWFYLYTSFKNKNDQSMSHQLIILLETNINHWYDILCGLGMLQDNLMKYVFKAAPFFRTIYNYK